MSAAELMARIILSLESGKAPVFRYTDDGVKRAVGFYIVPTPEQVN